MFRVLIIAFAVLALCVVIHTTALVALGELLMRRRSVSNRRNLIIDLDPRPLLRSLVPLILLSLAAAAQEMEPRAYSRAPVGTTYVVVLYGYSTGDVLTDSSTPLRDVSVRLNSISVGSGRTFNLAGKQAN